MRISDDIVRYMVIRNNGENYMNKVILVGNLTKTPNFQQQARESRYVRSALACK